jgi:hypothetical protein
MQFKIFFSLVLTCLTFFTSVIGQTVERYELGFSSAFNPNDRQPFVSSNYFIWLFPFGQILSSLNKWCGRKKNISLLIGEKKILLELSFWNNGASF